MLTIEDRTPATAGQLDITGQFRQHQMFFCALWQWSNDGFSMTSIRSLKPNVTREDAMRHFTAGSLNFAADLIRGRVQSIAELYIPYRLFRVKFTNAGKEESRIFALDAVQGTLDLYQFSGLPAETDLCTLDTRNALSSAVDASQAQERVVAKVRRLIFARGFFRLRDVQLEAAQIPGDLHIPYWICFRGSDGRVHFSILDAVRRRAEGAKARHLIEDWLRLEKSAVL